MRKIILSVIIVYAFSISVMAKNKHSNITKYPSYNGLVMAGYQGWFSNDNKEIMFPDENKMRIDMWPDLSEYEKTYPTGLKMADGSTAHFFSSDDKSTIDLHFKWMNQYNVDGAFMQRFFNRAKPENRFTGTTNVLRNALEAASKYERAIGVMYDLSGLKESGEDCSMLIEDWKYLVDSLRVTNQPGTQTYIYHRGKPLVTIWGLGFPDRPYNIRNIGIEKFIDFLKNDPEYGGCSVMLGIPTYWRDLNTDCTTDPYLHDLIKTVDIIMPWMVERFSPVLHFEMIRYSNIIKEDIEWCKKYGINYAPCVYPGFSWYNLRRNNKNSVNPLGAIPRQGGKFYWDQIVTAINADATMLYVAMFDEVNEGTAIFKCTDTPPVSDIAKFITMDGKPSDHYLWLTGEAGKMLRKEKPLTTSMPER